LRKVYIKLM